MNPTVTEDSNGVAKYRQRGIDPKRNPATELFVPSPQDNQFPVGVCVLGMERKRISTETEWEPIVGYSRAVRAGNEVHVSGTTATDEAGEVVAPDDPYKQTKKALDNIEEALTEAGAEFGDVVRTRLFVVDIDDWEEIGRAHGEVFEDVRPATSMVEVNRLIDTSMLVEIEAVAIVG